ncbi:hypothetical protein LSTR_LSTR011220 [Laodelphax striatellus]|uniref:protein-tyrosine-phosphatase n=1 Tax=Laodelphax striatellus TaxID=195883 RepID=A0A482XMB5_LAOST|nr:hypothetical protein LSTR_LSTR011220 [Laodelphax striatellus]
MKILIFFIVLSVIFIAVQKTYANWEVKPCRANQFKLKRITKNEISVISSSDAISLCQFRGVVAQINVTSENYEAVELGRLKKSGYSGDVISSVDSRIEKEFNLGQMKLFACVEYNIDLSLVARLCNNKIKKFKCSHNEKTSDRILDSTVITAYMNDVEPVDFMVTSYGSYGNNTRLYFSVSHDVQFCDSGFNISIYTANNVSGAAKIFEAAISKSDTLDIPNLVENITYTAFISLETNNSTEVTSINQTIPFILDKSSTNNIDWNVKNLHVNNKGETWVSLAWEPPGQQYSIHSYILELYSENGTLMVYEELAKNTTHINVTDALEPGSKYRMDLSTIAKELIAFSSINVTTYEMVLPPPDQGMLVEVNATAAILSWQVTDPNDKQRSMILLMTHCYNKAGKVFAFNSTERHRNGTVFVSCLGLEPFTVYSCDAVAVNLAGESNASLPLTFLTLQDVPSAPISVKVEEKTSYSVLITWDVPVIIPGVLTNYTVMISSGGPSYQIPDDCRVVEPWAARNQTVASTETFALLENLLPYYRYDVSVKAATEAGYGDASPEIRIITLPKVSETVRNMTINVHYNESVVTWRPPCISNGVIAIYSLTLTGSREGFDPIPPKTWFTSRDQNWDYLWDLLPETIYKFSISVLVVDVSEVNPLAKEFTSSARIPQVPLQITKDLVEVDPKLSSNPSCEAVVLIKPSFFNRDNGEIRYLALLVSEDKMLPDERMGIIHNHTWPHMTSWAVASSGQHVIMYQATPKWWNPLEGSETNEAIRYTLGQEACSDTDFHTYCNGPLMANTLYAMRIRVFTSAGYRDSPPIRFKTDFGFPSDFVMSLFLGLFVVTSLLIIIGYIVLSKRQWKSNRTDHKYLEELPAKKLLAHANVALEHKNLMHSEFLHLSGISDTLDLSSDVAKLPTNMPKNRYTNILPYDFNRVILEGEEGCDYINASYIVDETLKNEVEYIACQAPKENTAHDFWKMIVQCGVRAIVMLCNLREKNKDKCHWYFPEEFETLEFGDIAVHCSKKVANESFIQRFIVIKMKNQGEVKIDHYHFVDWPDFEAPSEAIPMIKLCQAVRADVGLATIAVHCSAGVGRTGTYIAVDMLLRHLHHRKKVSVFRTVLKLRGQRANMVQNEVQYAYIYKVLKHTLDNSTLFFRKGSRLLPSTRSASTSLDGSSLLSFSLKVRS